ncbi:putative metalloendopeptidase, glycoprotease family [Methanococcus vannielii SB]|uniref:Probable bifunctional tRNA threonylcarbamoyladenosine biosynthesis protein n=1 Tax=Methanococcus vannielii (strain ATCC 35089 / DSM 1224 / JCM 13029 / OCM 148 / SB) TaxID=406327 RepID=KAE1B_METVS|nr:bifunctional N(6)-L-threonylcarbamoyladenine synthase/serine/threonine protein kinase [Methanococcus vannielii]A6US28.1 RecName: Full=Probable bifunctional tRNA threonylcarbamoyladenosine biosynthesis protein; Includes: RecName: Full=tRNA N6-adenosine threonylcarbamoyltransferase; AltName: Full=N6-L-threonylcarbamoyladenine synthase; Short=t(6)A synthase; AltName: Full=t(6)A37 threonylcarbamoyladenosine biosynthesis protein Kae1; AltName: Full=tRNA threonylcarbamoyladenosine biosynthesis protei
MGNSNELICIGLEGTAEKTGVGVITSNGEVLFNKTVIYTPKIQGIHPREAADHHAETFIKLLNEVSGVIPLDKIDLVSFSQGPGLGPSLRVTATTGRALALSLKKPIIGVNHCVSHVEIGKLKTDALDPLTLYVSGGNTQVLAYTGKKYRVIGETLDIAIGNCLDQFARYCNLSHPGGVFVEQYAKEGKKFLKLPYTVKGMDISFSGLLTASMKKYDSNEKIEDVCYSLQETAFSMLTEITERALSHTNKPEIMLVGGVAANDRLKEMLEIMCNEQNVDFYVPEKQFCGDNGAMIAWLGILQYINGKRMDILDTKTIPHFRTDMVDVNWVVKSTENELDILNKKRQIPRHLIGKGAEADILKGRYLEWESITKERIKKGYRTAELDEMIRTRRTVKEARFLSIIKDFSVNSPHIFDIDIENKKITMEYIHGKLLKDLIEEGNLEFCKSIGELIGKMHEGKIIHNDLTTSNFIVNTDAYMIDFGLGKYSDLIEDKAIDLIVLKKSIMSIHYDKFGEIWDKIIEGYSKYGHSELVLQYIKEVEKRGRYL